MADEIIFANGIIFKLPRNGAPSFVKGSISFKVEEAIQWLKDNADGEWCNIDLKVSQQGKPYASLNTWKPNSGSYTSSAKNVNTDYQKSANSVLKDKGFTEEVLF